MFRRLMQKIIIWAMGWDKADLFCQEMKHKATRARARGIFTEPDDEFEYVHLNAGKTDEAFVSWRKHGSK